MRSCYQSLVSLAALVLLALLPAADAIAQQTATKAKTDKPTTTVNQDSSLTILYSKYASCTEDISPTTVPLAQAAIDVSTIGVTISELWTPNGYTDLQRLVGRRDADDKLRDKAIIVARRFRGEDGKADIWPLDPAQKFRIIEGVRNETTGDIQPPTPEQVRKEVLAYLEATNTPPPGSVAWVKAEAERREMLAQSASKPNNVKVTTNK